MNLFPSRLSLFLLPAILFGGAENLRAHVVLDAPNGGEVLRIGSVITIKWHILIPHNLQNWDLWYSTTGPNGPWIPIVMDLPAASTSYEWNVWTVPANSSQVRVRVRMDNAGTDYYDISNANLTVLPSLSAAPPSVSLSAGGTQTVSVDAGAANSGASYLIVGTFSGISPGLRLGLFAVPLNPDFYTYYTLGNPNTLPILAGTLGILDPSGMATAQITVPPNSPPPLVGIVVHHLLVVVEPSGTTTLVSNAVPLTLMQ